MRALFLYGMVVCSPLVCARAEVLYATDGTTISRFDTLGPETSFTTISVTGLQSGETVVGMDLRPSNSQFYVVGSTNRVYTINPLSGVATLVSTIGLATLDGTKFGVDFNPVADRLRVVSDLEQNLRINPADWTATTDGPLNPAGNVVEVAYSNNIGGATTTTLYAIDSVSGILGIISSPNGGGPITPIGSLGLGTNLNPSIGFDISGLTGNAYATVKVLNLTRLYRVNLTTGAATLLGNVGPGITTFNSLAAAQVPEPSTALGSLAAFGFLAGFRRMRRAVG